MSEYLEAYDALRRRTGRLLLRSDPVPPEAYPLVVNVWIRDGRGRFLLTRRSPEKSEPLKWEPPGGYALAGEDSRSAALREVREETGLALSEDAGRRFASFRRLRPTWENPGFLDVWVFPAPSPPGPLCLQPGETCEARWASPEEVFALISRGEFVPAWAHPYHRALFEACEGRGPLADLLL